MNRPPDLKKRVPLIGTEHMSDIPKGNAALEAAVKAYRPMAGSETRSLPKGKSLNDEMKVCEKYSSLHERRK